MRRERLSRHQTTRNMGIKTVAVYSEAADRDALHVEMADEAVAIGPPPAAESYLFIDRIVDACKSTGTEAVHPGYGFLSEREAFPRALKKAGIVFIGPIRTRSRRWATRSIQEGRRKGQSLDRAGPPWRHEQYEACSEDRPRARRRDRLSRDDQGLRRRRRQGHAHRPFEPGKSRKVSSLRKQKPNPHSATITSSSKSSSSIPATSRSRCSATSTATSSISESANARSSAATRR